MYRSKIVQRRGQSSRNNEADKQKESQKRQTERGPAGKQLDGEREKEGKRESEAEGERGRKAIAETLVPVGSINTVTGNGVLNKR